MVHGYGFYWPPYENPYMTDPDGTAIADIEVVGYCLMWEDEGSQGHTTYLERCGVPAPVIPPRNAAPGANPKPGSFEEKGKDSAKPEGKAKGKGVRLARKIKLMMKLPKFG